jgi:xanthine dehydrogenase accessory factor
VNDGSVLDGWGVLQHAAELARRGEEFVLATVVWREGPSSGQNGSRAIVMPTGEVIGWIGGACAEPVLIREAHQALAEQRARLLALGTSEQFGDVPQGMTAIAISCQSEGALQIFIEPVIPAPHLVVVGRSPMAHTLCELARALDWNAELIDGAEFSTEAVSPHSIVVVATQGHGDEDVLEQALAGDAPAYLGVVGSVRRGEALRGYLADRGASPERLDSIRVPVGLDLGRTSHREMAVAVLAELVELRAAGKLRGPEASLPAVAADAIDSICGMTVTADETSHPLVVGDETHYFCCVGCRSQFEKQAGSHLAGDSS